MDSLKFLKLLSKLTGDVSTLQAAVARVTQMRSVAFNGRDGADGAEGPRGLQGDQGDVGAQGDTGEPGRDGGTGNQGELGAQGETGPAGLQGPEGPTGPTGPAGNDGADGTDGAPGAPGRDGVDGSDGTDGEGITRVTLKDNVLTVWIGDKKHTAGTLKLPKLSGPFIPGTGVGGGSRVHNPILIPATPDDDYQIKPSDQFVNFEGDGTVTLPPSLTVIQPVYVTSTDGTVTMAADAPINGLLSITTDVTVGFYLARGQWWRF